MDEKCIEIATKVDTLHDRCDTKEKDVKSLFSRMAVVETKVGKLEESDGIQDKKLFSLSAWKNQALGWLAAIGALTMLIIEYFKGEFYK